ncbi:MAG: hypothetical protein ACT4OT_11840 [Acidobacteriota bacterium]
MPHQNGMPTLTELQTMSAEDLASKVDQQFSMTPDVRHLMLAQCFRDEQVRRQQTKQTDTILSYTRWMTWLTVIIAVATIVNVVIAFLLLRHPVGY